MLDEKDSLLERVEDLATQRGGYIKVNLPGEGLWAVLLTKKDREVYNKNTRGDIIKVVLANDPLTAGYAYGNVYEAVTEGDSRPVVRGPSLGSYAESAHFAT